MTRLIDIEHSLMDAFRQVDEYLERGEEPPTDLVKATELLSVGAEVKRDSMVKMFRYLDKMDELDDEEIERIKTLKARRAKDREWWERQIMIIMQSYGTKTLEGQRHRIMLVQNRGRVEPDRPAESWDGRHPGWVRVKEVIEWDKEALRQSIEAGDPAVPAKLVPGTWRLKIT